MHLTYPDIALQVPRVLLPVPEVAFDRWAVIACDQHTSEPAYWQQVEELVGESESTLKLVFPEVFLEDPDRSGRIAAINRQMRTYVDGGLLAERDPGFVLVERETGGTASRKGLLVCLDLEHYSFDPDAETLIRTTEGTDPNRLPPRVEIRRDAPLELPHILVLIDDPEGGVIDPHFDRRHELPLLYDFDLMMGGGHVRGWHVRDAHGVRQVVDSLSRLIDGGQFAARYDVADDKPPMLYALGDGNHSFATAQQVWQELKNAPNPPALDHPARYALVELVNIHDEGLTFEPIHRVVFDTDHRQLLAAFATHCRSQGSDLEIRDFDDRQQWERARADLEVDGHCLPFVAEHHFGIATIHQPRQQLAVATLQGFLSAHEGPEQVDYIHGSRTVDRLGLRPGNVGFYTQAIDKHTLFRTILLDGPLPRKSFSLGAAAEKRYYLESRRIGP